MTNKIALAFLTRELAPLIPHPPRNRKLWEMIVDGDLPAEQIGGRWYVDRGNLHAIAEILRRAETARPAPKRIRSVVA